MNVKGSQTVQKYNSRTNKFTRLAPVAVLSGFALSTLAGAQAETASLGASAATGMGGIIALVVVLLLIGIGIRALWFGNSQIKKGISASK